MRTDKEILREELKRNELIASQRINKFSAVRKLSHIRENTIGTLSPGLLRNPTYKTRASSKFYLIF